MPSDEVTIYPPASIPSRPCRYYAYSYLVEGMAGCGWKWREVDLKTHLAFVAFLPSIPTVRLLAVEQPEQ